MKERTFTISLTAYEGKLISDTLCDLKMEYVRTIEEIGEQRASEYGYTDTLNDLRELIQRFIDAMDDAGLYDLDD